MILFAFIPWVSLAIDAWLQDIRGVVISNTMANTSHVDPDSCRASHGVTVGRREAAGERTGTYSQRVST
jgi:hypothetical protein